MGFPDIDEIAVYPKPYPLRPHSRKAFIYNFRKIPAERKRIYEAQPVKTGKGIGPYFPKTVSKNQGIDSNACQRILPYHRA